MTAPLTDLELMTACAQACGYTVMGPANEFVTYGELPSAVSVEFDGGSFVFHPLLDDAQAMALVKRFGLYVCSSHQPRAMHWHVKYFDSDGHSSPPVIDIDLNRAICLCCAAMTAPKD